MSEGPLLIRGERVLLRDPVSGDVEHLVRWWTTETAWMEWDAPWEEETDDEDAIRRRWSEFVGRPTSTPRPRVIVCREDGRPIGTVNLYGLGDQPDGVALGIGIYESDEQERGLGTEAFGLWIDYVFRSVDKDRLYCETWSGNVRMVRLAARWGFREIRRLENARIVRGESYDAVRFALQRAEWTPLEAGQRRRATPSPGPGSRP